MDLQHEAAKILESARHVQQKTRDLLDRYEAVRRGHTELMPVAVKTTKTITALMEVEAAIRCSADGLEAITVED